jgi:hypothetical protein
MQWMRIKWVDPGLAQNIPALTLSPVVQSSTFRDFSTTRHLRRREQTSAGPVTVLSCIHRDSLSPRATIVGGPLKGTAGFAQHCHREERYIR